MIHLQNPENQILDNKLEFLTFAIAFKHLEIRGVPETKRLHCFTNRPSTVFCPPSAILRREEGPLDVCEDDQKLRHWPGGAVDCSCCWGLLVSQAAWEAVEGRWWSSGPIFGETGKGFGKMVRFGETIISIHGLETW